MELYPLIEPFVNYTKEKATNFASESHKIATGLTNVAIKGARRMLNTEDEESEEDLAVNQDANLPQQESLQPLYPGTAMNAISVEED